MIFGHTRALESQLATTVEAGEIDTTAYEEEVADLEKSIENINVNISKYQESMILKSQEIQLLQHEKKETQKCSLKNHSKIDELEREIEDFIVSRQNLKEIITSDQKQIEEIELGIKNMMYL